MDFRLGLGLTARRGSSARPHFYVDSVNGSDGYDGLTAATAFATLAAAETAALTHGDGVYVAVKRGSHWRESLDLSSLDGARVIAYGDASAALPKFDCADVASNAAFSLAASQTNTYQISWTHSVALAIGKNKLRLWEDGVPLKWVSSIANCEAEAGTFYVRNDLIETPATIYVHPTGSTNPVSDGKVYEITRRNFGLSVGDNWTVKDVHTTRNAGHDGSFLSGHDGYGERILSTHGVVHNQWIGAGSTAVGCVAHLCEPSTWRNLNATLFITYAAYGHARGTTFRNCRAYSDAPAGNPHSAIYAHTTGGANRLAGLTVEGFCGYGPAPTVSVNDTDGLTVTNTWLERPTTTEATWAAVGSPVVTNVDNIVIINAARAFAYAEGLTVRDARILFGGGGSSGGAFWTNNNDVQNCTFVFSASPSNTHTLTQSGKGGGIFRNNIVDDGEWRTLSVAAGETLDSDFNVIWRSSASSTYFNVGATEYNWANWKSTTSNDANSYLDTGATAIVTDPLNNDWTFTDTAPDEGGRTAGSRKTLEAPDWASLTAAWDAGYIAPSAVTLISSVPGVTLVGISAGGSTTITASGGAYDGASATFTQAQIDSGLPLQIAAPVQLADTGETRNILPGLYASTNVIEYLTRWYRSGAEIVGETGSSYTFVAGDDLLDIEYRETASTVAGTAAGAPHVVVVNEAPSFAPTVYVENFSGLSVGATEATIEANADLAPLVTNDFGSSIVANASAPGGKALQASTYTTIYLDGVTIPADWTHLIIRAAYERTQFPPPSTRYDIIRLEYLGAEVAYAQASHQTNNNLSTKAWMGAGSTGDNFAVTGGHQTLELGLRNSGGTSYLYAKSFDENDVQRGHRFIASASPRPIDRIRISTAAPDYLYAGIRVEFHNRTDATNPDGWPTE